MAALYLQHMNDAVVREAVNDIESLATSLSQKVWQKIMILDAGMDVAAWRGERGVGGTLDHGFHEGSRLQEDPLHRTAQAFSRPLPVPGKEGIITAGRLAIGLDRKETRACRTRLP